MAKVKLQRPGYYTIPPLDKLDDYVCGETCIVPNFTVGREGYGNVYFPDSFDVYGLNLDDIGKLCVNLILICLRTYIAYNTTLYIVSVSLSLSLYSVPALLN